MTVKEILEKFHQAACNPSAAKERYLAEGKKVVLVAPIYTPEEIIHSMGAVPMGAWGADTQLSEAKKYFPAFICAIVQSLVELGIRGTYQGASAIVIPTLCDSLKVTGQNWKYAVPSIKFIQMSYPQNRKPEFGHTYCKAGYERVIRDLQVATGLTFDEAKLEESLKVYNEHNQVMREAAAVLADHPEVTAMQRKDIFKSAWFMLKEEHTALVRELIAALREQKPGEKKLRIMISGILADAPGLLQILDDCNTQVVCDDVANESRQYRFDAPLTGKGLDDLVEKFCSMDYCTVLYDPDKKRIDKIVEDAKAAKADGVLLVLTKFCDPEEFDMPLIRNALKNAGVPVTQIEVDRQMTDYAQARTAVETMRDLLEA